MKRRNLLALAICLHASLTFAQVSIDIPAAQRRAAIPIAIVPVPGDSEQMDYIIASDLFKSGYFQPIAPDMYQNRPNSPNEIDYAQFAQLGAQYVVLGRLVNGANNVQFVMNRVVDQSVLMNEEVRGVSARMVAHATADRILEVLTGKRGAFATRIAYVLEQTRNHSRRYALVVSDVDGGNRHEIASSDQPILSPTWSPDGRQLAYMTYADYQAQIVVQGADGGSRRVVLQSDSTSSAPAWSPDGSQLAVSLSNGEGNMDVYVVDIGSGASRRLTDHAGIDTEPAFSPDGGSIYFTSDRAGSPQIYRMGRGGGGAERVVVGGNYSSNAELSPDGKYLALTRQSGGGYQIGLYELGSGRFTALTSGRLDEGATFAPNGEMLMYTAMEGGRSVLKLINLKGEVVQTLSDPSGRLRDPTWAPHSR